MKVNKQSKVGKRTNKKLASRIVPVPCVMLFSRREDADFCFHIFRRHSRDVRMSILYDVVNDRSPYRVVPGWVNVLFYVDTYYPSNKKIKALIEDVK